MNALTPKSSAIVCKCRVNVDVWYVMKLSEICNTTIYDVRRPWVWYKSSSERSLILLGCRLQDIAYLREILSVKLWVYIIHLSHVYEKTRPCFYFFVTIFVVSNFLRKTSPGVQVQIIWIVWISCPRFFYAQLSLSIRSIEVYTLNQVSYSFSAQT